MRTTTFVTAAFAAVAMAAPFADVKERAEVVVTATDVVVVTDVVYVTATGPSPAVVYTTTTVPARPHHSHHHHHHSHPAPPPPPSSSVAPPPSSSAAPVPTSSYVPPPAPSSEPAPTSSYAPPASSSAAPAPSSSAPSSNPSGSSYSKQPLGGPSGDAQYKAAVYNHHNIHRANHSAPAIQWDDGLYATALKIAQKCYYAHDTTTDGGGYGQNIAAGVKDSAIASVISDMFYNGEVNYYAGLYGQASPDTSGFEHWGHFSQIVWKDTTKVGCATVDCTAKGLANVGSNVPPYFTVCNYSPPGNYAGQYTNVGRPIGQGTVNGDA